MTRKRKHRRKSKPKPETSLYVPCPQCGGSGEKYPDDEVGSVYPCVCHNGFIETGFTQERFDALVTRSDKLLIAVDDALRVLCDDSIPEDRALEAACGILKKVAGTPDELITAKSHFRTDS